MLGPVLERTYDRRAARSLCGVNPWQLAVDESDLSELPQSAGNPWQQRAAGDRRYDVIGVLPAQLLDDLKSHRLRAFGVVRAQVDVHEAPAVAVRHLRAEPVHIVVIAVDGVNRRAEDRRTENLSLLEVVGNEHAAFEAETRRVRRDAVGEVTGRRTGDDLEPEFDGAGGCNRHHTILVR